MKLVLSVRSWPSIALKLLTMSIIFSRKVSIVKEYAQAEGVSAGFRVDSELAADLSRGIGVSETVECSEKVQCTSARPHVDLVPVKNGTGTSLTRVDT